MAAPTRPGRWPMPAHLRPHAAVAHVHQVSDGNAVSDLVRTLGARPVLRKRNDRARRAVAAGGAFTGYLGQTSVLSSCAPLGRKVSIRASTERMLRLPPLISKTC